MAEISLDQIYRITVAAADKALADAGLKKQTMTHSEAKELYGEYKVRKWVDQGMIKRIKQGRGKNSQVCYTIEDLHRAELGINFNKTK